MDAVAEAEKLLRSAMAEARTALSSEIGAAREREEELEQVVLGLKAQEEVKRERAATERELAESLSAVALATPEASIAERLSKVADAKRELIAVDTALAEEFSRAVKKIDEDAALASQDRQSLEATLANLPDDEADGRTVRTYDWDALESALSTIVDNDRREEQGLLDADNLRRALAQYAKKRDEAVASAVMDADRVVAVPPADNKAPSKDKLKGAVKGVAQVGMGTAAKVGDWVLSDKPAAIADDIKRKLRQRASEKSS